MTETSEQPRSSFLEDTGLSCLLIIACLRMLTTIDPYPYWSGDPLVRFTPLTGLGPSFAAGLDIVTIISAMFAMIGAASRGRTVSWTHYLLWAAGAFAVFVHIGLGANFVLQHALSGLPWVAALTAGITVHGLARDPRHRRLILSTFAGLAMILLCKSIVQIYFEHPAMVKAFEHDRLAIFAENGWSPDSSTARAYERRILQPEASGWIGLANPFATFAAIAATIGFAGVVIPVSPSAPKRIPWPAILLLLAGMFTTFLAGAKGGFASMSAGFALVLIAKWCPQNLRRRGALLGIAAPLGILCLVALRGAIGVRLGELSILFRCMYAQAALRIFAQHPVSGVGPAGFKDAYLLAKNPLSPEEVTSPHSVFLDYIATLGIGGVAWLILLLLFCAAAGKSLLSSPASENPADTFAGADRADIRRVMAILAIPTLFAAWLETSIATPEELAVRMGGLTLGSIISGFMLNAPISRQALTIASAAAALVAIIHGQIELTPILSQTALWFAIILAAAPTIQTAVTAENRRSATKAIPVGIAMIAALFAFRPIVQWESSLNTSATLLEPLSTIRLLLAAAPKDPRALAEAADIASQASGHAVARDVASIESAFGSIASQRIPIATVVLADAATQSHGDPATLRSLSQFNLQTANGDAGRARIAEQSALDAAQSHTALSRSTSWAWVGTVQRGLYDRDKNKMRLTAARDAYLQAIKFDPYSLPPVMKLVELAIQTGDTEAAKTWAAKALELDALMRLDPLKGLSAEQAAKMHQLSGVP